MPGVTVQEARLFTDPARAEVDMVFQFEHMSIDQAPNDKYVFAGLDLVVLKKSLHRWQAALADAGWNSLYWNNHDQPRAVSRFGDDTTYWFESATALATVLHLHRGTPYVYQGEELGMTNVPFAGIESFRDIESLNYFDDQTVRLGADAAVVVAALRRSGRDNARTPMQWTGERGAGFSRSTPWIPLNPNHTWLNAASQIDDPMSVFAYYRDLIALRHAQPIVVLGDFALLEVAAETVYAFTRGLGDQRLDVFANLSGEFVTVDEAGLSPGEVLVGNYPPAQRQAGILAPWEARALLR
jgi:oligo-1,6-glucosidase